MMKYLIVDAGVRYFEDAEINGVSDDDGTLTPFVVDGRWKPVIDIEAGTVVDWPEGMTASIHFKVCDDGEYWLSSDGKDKIQKWADYYVPNDFLCHGDNGYGDYIILNVSGDGKIEKYRKPEIDLDDFAKAED